MRLICPSCGAQYEVDESVIPDAGRDVQCSNCGNAWFQMSAAQLKAEEARAAEAEAAGAEVDETEDWVEEAPEEVAEADEPPLEIEPSQEVAAEETEEDWGAAEDVAEDTADAVEEPEAAPAPEEPAPAPKRKTLDDAVMNVLREEADRERRAREAEGSLIETQPDLGIPAEAAAASVAAAVAAAQDDDAPEVEDEVYDPENEDSVVSRAARKELLPDIEEINSSLRATSDRGGEAASVDAPATLRRRRSGFRMGFVTAIVIAVILLLVYAFAPAISSAVPAASGAMEAYVAGVDGARSWLDATLQGLTASMTDGET
ncbi:putative Zn finger-like uncharacterized protein [Defluviimonas denitrificans]|jgi:predicted Zn finger-like uncharacterized protein|uniref:Putative Zn finger-like uncharacterized protein n=1 Tax=Albidovulum denitrificans TaxID=404881 RepID=A0A2S8S5U5_9RHOB|nr:zinc-ribbon domain-containing protein [Defluviimonas denitrificans]PQV56153.1 putative Zn finger-like uncharacterized protein [Defluviimonas denitrificans]